MASEEPCAPAVWRCSASLFGLGLFTLPYAFRTAGVAWCSLLAVLSVLASLALSQAVCALARTHRKLQHSQHHLTTPLLEAEKKPVTTVRLSDLVVDCGRFQLPGKQYIKAAIDTVCVVYMAEMAIYTLHSLCFYLSLIASATLTTAVYPGALVVFTIALSALAYRPLGTMEKAFCAGTVSTILLLVLAAAVSVGSGRLSDPPPLSGPLERLTLIPGLAAFFCYQIPLISVTTGHKSLGKGEVAAVAGFALAAIAFGGCFSLWFPESPHMLKSILTQSYYGVTRFSLSYYALIIAFSVLIITSCVASTYFYMRTLHDFASASGYCDAKQVRVPLLIGSVLAYKHFLYAGSIEDFLLLDPMGAMGVMGLMAAVAIAYEKAVGSSACGKALYALLATAFAVAACDFTLEWKVVPICLIASAILAINK